jgi:colanic acid biosynthesis glycosyl transferase WcaI
MTGNSRVVIVTSNFFPERTGIGQVTTELAEYLASHGQEVSVITAMPYYPEWEIYPVYRSAWLKSESVGSVNVHRAWHFARPNPTSIGRIIHEVTLCAASIPNFIRYMRGADRVFLVSPDLSFAAVGMWTSRLLGKRRLLIVQDVQPEAAVDLGMLRNRFVVGLAKRIAKYLYAHADEVITLSDSMARRINAEMDVSNKLRIVPNTIDTRELEPATNQRSSFRARFVPDDTLAVVHAGNMGEKQDLSLLLRTARLLRDHRNVHFYVFGDGSKKSEFLKLRNDWDLTNVSHYPFQDRAVLPQILHGADVLLISQLPEVIDTVVPSKLVTAMGAGAMIVAACSVRSETARLLSAAGGGLVIRASDEQALADAILRIEAGAEDVARHRQRVRQFAVDKFDRQKVYAGLL